MKNIKLLFACLLLTSIPLSAQYNTLWIPPTLTGTSFNLEMKEGVSQIVATGNQTVTAGINGNVWGPTLIINKGDNVQMSVKNSLNESTTLHWHGMHLPAVMDGGPHQVIPVGTTWQPYWTMLNNAGTYWYHPHLHETTMKQVHSGLGGLMIVKDAVESALPLPRT